VKTVQNSKELDDALRRGRCIVCGNIGDGLVRHIHRQPLIVCGTACENRARKIIEVEIGKTYLVDYTVIDGENEYPNFFITQIHKDDKKTIEQLCDEFFTAYFGEESEKIDDRTYQEKDGGRLIQRNDIKEIPVEDYEVLSRYEETW